MPPSAHDEIAVIESSVFVYRRGQHWEARVTQHGGPHWVRQVENLESLEEVAMEALRSKARPPTGEWTVEAEWTE